MSTYIVTNLNDSGIGSLRNGIIYANTNPNTIITFFINGNINLLSSLPKIINPTQIIGNLSGQNVPLITINGNKKYKIDGVNFKYQNIKDEVLFNNNGIISKKGYSIATCERAFLDMIYLNKNSYLFRFSACAPA